MKRLDLWLKVTLERGGRFGISCGPKLGVWYGMLTPGERFAGDLDAAYGAGLLKCCWLGKEVRAALGLGKGELTVRVQAPCVIVARRRLRSAEVNARWGGVVFDFGNGPREGGNPADCLVLADGYGKPDLERAARCVVEQGYVGSDR